MEFLRVISIIMVVVIHVAAPIFYKNINILGNRFILVDILDSFSRVSVPIFLFISGRYLVGKKERIKDFYKKRMKRIGPAFIFFTIIYAFLNYYMFRDINRLIKDIFKGDTYYQMWYLYMITVLYLVTPAIWFFRDKGKRYLNIISIISLSIGIIQCFLKIEVLWCFQFSYYIGYYILGYTLKDIKIIKLKRYICFLGYFLLSIVTAYLTYKTCNTNYKLCFFNYLSPFTILASILFYITFKDVNIKDNKFINFISKESFGIYLIHPLILYVIDKYIIINNIFFNISFRFILCFLISLIIIFFYKNSIKSKKILNILKI